ncbi:hypothetical protein VSDG_00823 [Cytospora chrysosperma]|uniref:Uncharacterized protein n=1 Tax=Cytospora chrysosperma TaxID=252740 RepID=A0A423WKM3_CYTCH|nr:hypothetical protein VSDG_00823 [Valsa sordida]
MNFHISPLSPLRPRYSTSLSPSSAARPSGPSEQNQQREPDDDHDDDENDDQHRGTDQHHHQQNHYRHRFLVLPHHAPPPRTPAARRSPLASRPKIEVDGGGHDVNTTSNSSGSSGSSSDSSVISADDDDDDDDDDVTQDSRDVLVQRLNDLAGRLGAADKVRGGDVGALHAHVDAMERVLSAGSTGGGRRRRRGAATARSTTTAMTTATATATGGNSLSAAAGRRGSSLQRNGRSSMVFPGGGGGGGGGNSGDALGLMGPPLSPSWLLSQLQRRQPSISSLREVKVKEKEKEEEGGGGGVDDRGRTNGARPVVPPPTSLHPLSSTEHPDPVVAAAATTPGSPSSSRISYEMADTIVQEAEGLCAEMASVIESLQKRREESDHLQAILVEREVAADKLLREQAGRIGELEGAAAEDESELRYLRIQLRAIEAQCLGYVPAGADPELDRSIRSWKDDWSELRGRWAARKGSSFAAAAGAAVTGPSSESGGSTLSGPARLGSPVAL